MGARYYVPQLGRFLQPDPIPGGSANAYAYTFGDPVNESDPSGEFSAWLTAANKNMSEELITKEAAREATEKAAREAAAREAAAREEAEYQATLAAEQAATAAGPGYMGEGGEEWGEEEWYEEEGGYEEYVSYHPGVGGKGEAHVEPAVLYQPLPEGLSSAGTEASEPEQQRTPVAGGCPSTHDPCWKQVIEGNRKHRTPGFTRAAEKCVGAAGGYGVIGKFVDGVDLTPEGAAATCLWGILFG